jgi:hypothetical protein
MYVASLLATSLQLYSPAFGVFVHSVKEAIFKRVLATNSSAGSKWLKEYLY